MRGDGLGVAFRDALRQAPASGLEAEVVRAGDGELDAARRGPRPGHAAGAPGPALGGHEVRPMQHPVLDAQEPQVQAEVRAAPATAAAPAHPRRAARGTERGDDLRARRRHTLAQWLVRP